MMHTANFVAADLGASSGRIMLGQWDSRTFSIQELHRFANDAVRVGDGLYWDILGIWSHIRAGLAKYHACCPQPPLGIAVDAWGVDFGLLDRAGRLIGNPRHYRDPRTAGIPQLAFEAVAEREWFTETGVQTMPINTLFQLYSMVRAHDPALVSAETLLTIPDLCAYFLCGEKMVEWTEAATTQMYSSKRKDWARALLSALNVPVNILPPVTRPGAVLSPVRADVIEECGFTQPFPAIAVGSHDTASAVAAIPNMSEDSVFLSSGTWSLMGVETAEPDTSEEALRLGIFMEVVEPDDLLARARELAASFAAKPPQAVRLTKRLLRHAQRMEFGDYLDICAMAQGMCHHTADHVEAVTAFLEKRPPSFQGC